MSKHDTQATAAKKTVSKQHQPGQEMLAMADTTDLSAVTAKQLAHLFDKHGQHDTAHHHAQPADAAGDTYVVNDAANADANNAVVSDAAAVADKPVILAGGTVGAVSPAEATAAPAAVAPLEAAPAPAVIAPVAAAGFPAGAVLGGLALVGLAAAAGGGGGGGSSSGTAASSGGPVPATTTPTPTVGTAAGGTTLDTSGSTPSTGLTVTPSTPASTVQTVTVTGVDVTCPTETITQVATVDANGVYHFDATRLADGMIHVNVVEKDANGVLHTNVVILDKDTAGVTVHGTDHLVAADVSTSTALTVTPQAGATITSVTVTGTGLDGKSLSETATLVNGKYTFDATQFADGHLTVDVAGKDASGNVLPDTIVTLVKDTDVVTVDGAKYLNTVTATGDTALTVIADAGATISTVTVTGTDIHGNALTETATLQSDGKFHLNAHEFADGNLNVHVVENSNGAAVSHDVTIIKDMAAPAAVTIDHTVNIAHLVDKNGHAHLVLHTVEHERVTGVTVAGLTLSGQPLIETATIDAQGNVQFDAAKFADGTLTVSVHAVTDAGNEAINTLTITKDMSIATIGGDSVLTANEITTTGNTQTATLTINPTADANQNITITKVTVTGTDASGHSQTVTANPVEAGSHQYTFDTSNFADGNLTVTVSEKDANGALPDTVVQLTKDTSLVHVQSFGTVSVDDCCGQVGNATLTVTPPAGTTVTGVTVTGTDLNGNTLTQTATVDANGQYHFDASQFADGSLKVNVTELANGTSTTQTVTIDKNTSIVVAGTGGVLDFNTATADATLNITAGGGAQVTAVTVTGLNAAGNAVITESATLGTDGKFHFNAKDFADGSLHINVMENNGAGDHIVTLLKDTTNVNGNMVLNINESVTDAALNINASAGETINRVQITGIDINGKTITETAILDKDGKAHFDATQFADGKLNVHITETDRTGVLVEHAVIITKDTQLPLIADHVNVVTGHVNVTEQFTFPDVSHTVTVNEGLAALTALGLSLSNGVIGGNATADGFVWVTGADTDVNSNTATESFQLAVTTNTVTLKDGDDINNVGAIATTFNETSGHETIHIHASLNDVIHLTGGNDTVDLDGSLVNLQFAQLTGSTSATATDVLSLTTSNVTLDLSNYNTANGHHAVLQHFEQINLLANGNQTVKLSATDLFNEHSDFTLNGSSTLVISGDKSDTVSTHGLTLQTGNFDATGKASAAGGYDLYTGTATDSHGVNHQVDLLLQHTVTHTSF